MSDALLRSRLIRLASANPSLRKDILPLLKGGSVPASKNAGGAVSPPDDPRAVYALNALMASFGSPRLFEKSKAYGKMYKLPPEFASLHTDLRLEVNWATTYWGTHGKVSWQYEGNGSPVGFVAYEIEKDRWGWQQDSSKGNEHGYIE